MPEEKTFTFNTADCVKVRIGNYEECLAPISDEVPISDDKNVGPFTSICDTLALLPINDGLRDAERIIEDLISDGVKPKRLKKVMECLGRTECAIDELYDYINAIKLKEYQRRFGRLPRNI